MLGKFGKATQLSSVSAEPVHPPRPEGSKFKFPGWAKKAPEGVSAFVTIEKDNVAIDRFDLAGKWCVVLGRNPSMVDQLLEHPTISREHAVFAYDGKDWKICDLGSAQGSMLNESPVAAFKWTTLEAGDKLAFAESTRTYVMHFGEEPASKKRKVDSGDGDGGNSHKEVRCRHLLIKHEGSRRPASWRSPEGITRSKKEAQRILEKHAERLKLNPAKFGSIAGDNSDCSSAKKQGDLGFFGRGKMQKPFEKAAFALDVGEMSGIVETDSGLHIILRDA